MFPPTPLNPTDLQALTREIELSVQSIGVPPAEALRCVIERHGLSDYDGVRLFSALISAMRDSAQAA